MFDGIFGDISLSQNGYSVEIDTFDSKEQELENIIRGRLKSIDGDYGTESKFSLIKNIGSNIIMMEELLSKTIRNMLTYDNLVKTENLEVLVYRGSDNKLYIGIRVTGNSSLYGGILDITINREEGGVG